MRAIVLVPLLVAAGCGKPDVKFECLMNGHGSGHCSFTNSGTSAGALCGYIRVTKLEDNSFENSSTFCSGEVKRQSTTKVEFTIPKVGSMCASDGTKSWMDVCDFQFRETTRD